MACYEFTFTIIEWYWDNTECAGMVERNCKMIRGSEGSKASETSVC